MEYEVKQLILSEIREMMGEQEELQNYSFPDELNDRMSEKELSSVALGKRAFVSHTIVDEWRKGITKPNGKERMKELGMALSFNAEELDRFLYKNGYPKLYVKNKFDCAAIYLLQKHAGEDDIVELYRETINRLGLASISINKNNNPSETKEMNDELKEAAAQSRVTQWVREHREDFTGDEKAQLPDPRILSYISLYICDTTINNMVVKEELPLKLKRTLYSLFGRNAVKIRGLREKLIVFGIYENMTVEEIDRLLEYARLRTFSETESSLDNVLFYAVQSAHDRYPFYECENAERIVNLTRHSAELYYKLLYPVYIEKLKKALKATEKYDKRKEFLKKNRTREAIKEYKEMGLFERNFPAYSERDRGLIDYVRDFLSIVKEKNKLPVDELEPIWDILFGENYDAIQK